METALICIRIISVAAWVRKKKIGKGNYYHPFLMEVRKSALDFGQVQWDWKGSVSAMASGLLFLCL